MPLGLTPQNANKVACYFYGALIILFIAARALIERLALDTDIIFGNYIEWTRPFLHFYLLGLPIALIGGAYCFMVIRERLFACLRYIHKTAVVVLITFVAYFFLHTALQLAERWLDFYSFSIASSLVLLPLFYLLLLYEEKPKEKIRRLAPIAADILVLTIEFCAVALLVSLGLKLRLEEVLFSGISFGPPIFIFAGLTFLFIVFTYLLLVAWAIIAKIKQAYGHHIMKPH